MNLANLHPLLVHLPIGIIFIGFLMELWQLKYPNKISKEMMLFILGNGAFFAVLSVATGWLLGDGGGYDDTMLSRHKWMGIAFTLTIITLFFIKKSDKPLAKKSYLPLFAISLLLLTITGHLGGNMTHGEGFLFAEKADKTIEIENIEEAEVYAQVIQPIFEAKCVSCHNSSKIKGGLQLKTQEHLLAGGDTGSLFDTITEHGSNLLMHRIDLPMEDEEHMPPKGKQQLTEEEMVLLEWWIKNKNCFDCKVADLDTDAKTEEILATLETDNSTRGKLARELDFIASERLVELAQNNISVQQLSIDNPLLQVNFSQREDVSEDDFYLLKSVNKNIVEMNLGHTNFNDTLAKHLKKFKNLTKLQLQGTAITPKSFDTFKDLEYLESLNLFGVKASEPDFKFLKQLPNLADVYLSPNSISDEGNVQLAQNGILVHGQHIDEKFKASQLAPPVFLAEHEIFNDSLLVTISTVFDDTKTFYRYARMPGDTVTVEYKEPFYLKKSMTFLAHSEKEGWGVSEPAKATFLKTGAKITDVTLTKRPHEKYKAQGPKTLIDKKRGTTNFVDGQWIGYEASHLQSTLTLEEATRISTVSVGHLSAPTSWIFSPIGYKVWGASDGKNYKLLKTIDLPPNPPSSSVERQLVNIHFDETKLKSVRVQVLNQRKNPNWHPNPGGDSFIFVDEIVLN
ncbi:c-type cytochrome domain-containing protein [Allomuricauda sp. d1]|uniref:c-type cytochrome domain-containing protein n=1 Tax=Allomuricauda sp. d1 TaxID=3136725 RepID=UPI0031E35107